MKDLARLSTCLKIPKRGAGSSRDIGCLMELDFYIRDTSLLDLHFSGVCKKRLLIILDDFVLKMALEATRYMS